MSTAQTSFTEKYRPYHIEDLVGQPSAKRMVGAWLRAKRVPRSILIEGPMSAGKTTTARIIARSALCLSAKDGVACGKCLSCLAFDKGNHNDYVEMNSASDRGIDAMRSLADKIRMMPVLSSKRIVVLDECHEITKQGYGAMLKPLEEPPEHVIFMLVTTNPEKILDTIVSRCSKLRLHSLSVEDCTSILADVSKDAGLGKAGITQEHLTKIATVTHAHPRNALHALDQIYTLVLDATDSGQVIDTALINTFIKDVAVTDIEAVAAAIAKDIINGQTGAALKRAEDCWSQSDLLLTKITELLRQAMLRSTNPKLMNPAYENVFGECRMFTVTDAKHPERLTARKAVLDAYGAFTQLKIMATGYSVPVEEVIGEAIARAALTCQICLTSHAPKVKKDTSDQ